MARMAWWELRRFSVAVIDSLGVLGNASGLEEFTPEAAQLLVAGLNNIGPGVGFVVVQGAQGMGVAAACPPTFQVFTLGHDKSLRARSVCSRPVMLGMALRDRSGLCRLM